MAWGFARLGHRSERSEKLFGGVAQQLIQRTWHFKPQDVGATLWSFATAEFFDYDAFRAGAARLNFRHIRSFKVCFWLLITLVLTTIQLHEMIRKAIHIDYHNDTLTKVPIMINKLLYVFVFVFTRPNSCLPKK